MAETKNQDVEELARALAYSFARRWTTMPSEAAADDDANNGRRPWLRRASIILDAVDRAIAAEVKSQPLSSPEPIDPKWLARELGVVVEPTSPPPQSLLSIAADDEQ